MSRFLLKLRFAIAIGPSNLASKNYVTELADLHIHVQK